MTRTEKKGEINSRGMHPNSGKTVYTSPGRGGLDHGGTLDREKRQLEIFNYMLAKLRVANKPPANIVGVLSAMVDTRFQTIRFLVPNFFPIGGVA